MPVLGNDDFKSYNKAFRKLFRENATLRAEWETNAPSKAEAKAGFQALEDGYTAQRVAFKALVDTAIGFTTSNALAKEIEDAWMKNKALG